MLGKDGTAPLLTYGENGKPYLADNPDTFFSITHLDKWAILAVADCEIGMDAQMPRKVCPRLAARSTTPEEQAWIKEDTEPNFTRLWTMKEAYLKYTGTGLTIPVCEVTISIPPTDGYDEGNNCYWALLNYEDIPLSICSSTAIDNTRIETIKSLP
jgi:4'-phosphopantetheinyl transferase